MICTCSHELRHQGRFSSKRKFHSGVNVSKPWNNSLGWRGCQFYFAEMSCLGYRTSTRTGSVNWPPVTICTLLAHAKIDAPHLLYHPSMITHLFVSNHPLACPRLLETSSTFPFLRQRKRGNVVRGYNSSASFAMQSRRCAFAAVDGLTDECSHKETHNAILTTRYGKQRCRRCCGVH